VRKEVPNSRETAEGYRKKGEKGIREENGKIRKPQLNLCLSRDEKTSAGLVQMLGGSNIEINKGLLKERKKRREAKKGKAKTGLRRDTPYFRKIERSPSETPRRSGADEDRQRKGEVCGRRAAGIKKQGGNPARGFLSLQRRQA